MTLSARLAARFAASFPEHALSWRTVGREAEYPVVHPDGTAADIAVLWPRLAEGVPHTWTREGELITGVELDGVTWSSEVGRGTIEAVLPPFRDLHAMKAGHERAMARLVAAAKAEGLLVLGYGIQPLTPGTPEFMTPKRRYQVLLDTLGETWLWFTLTASDQCHVAVARDEVLRVANLTNLLCPVSIALLANSPVYGGQDSGFCSAREATMGRIHAGTFRHGMPAGPSADPEDHVLRSYGLTYLMHKERDGTIRPVGEPFGAWLEAQGFDDDEAFRVWQYHDHYMWHSSRPRVVHGTVELRSPCQQPWPEHMAAAAYGLGIVEGWRSIEAFVHELLGDDAWAVMRQWHGEVVRDGLLAPEPAPGLVAGVLDRASEALRARGLGEEALLAPLLRRWDDRLNPAQRARSAFARHGVVGLVAHAAIR